MQSCFSCSSGLSERGYHCPNCGIQVRCKQCKELLELNARACVMCGMKIGEESPGEALGANSGVAHNFNTLTIDDYFTPKSRHRKLNARFSDIAAEKLGDVLITHAANRMEDDWRINHKSQPPPLNRQPKPLPLFEAPQVTEAETESGFIQGKSEALDPLQGSEKLILAEAVQVQPGSTRISKLISFDGENFRLEEPRLKAQGKLDYAKRLSCLFVFAHETLGKRTVTRSALNALLKKYDLLDPHTITWITNCLELEKDGDDIRLIRPGRDLVNLVLDQIEDSEKDVGWLPGTSSVRKGDGRQESATTKQKTTTPASKTKGKSTQVQKWVSDWRSQHPTIKAHSLLSDSSNLDKCLFALWAIRSIQGDADKIVSDHHLSLFIFEAFEFKLHRQTVVSALKSKGAKGKVINVTGGKFQITQTGMDYAEQLYKGGKKSKS